MAQWYANELSKLTQVSVRTLHYYDRIDLLKPSLRLANGYRVYSEKDLLKLQQIVALKFFGFKLSQIKKLIEYGVNVLDHFSMQSQRLQEKAAMLLEASQTLNAIISECEKSESIAWEKFIKLIEVYRMTQEIEKSWAGKALNAEELKEYIDFQQNLKTQYTEAQKNAFEKKWNDLVVQIENNIHEDPTSEIGIAFGKRCMDLVNELYGKKYANLRTVVWEKGFKSGQMDEEHGLSSQSIAWLDQAIGAYYQQRIDSIFKQLETHSSDVVLKLWNELLEEMYGDAEALKVDFNKMIMENKNISQLAKEWIQKTFKI